MLCSRSPAAAAPTCFLAISTTAIQHLLHEHNSQRPCHLHMRRIIGNHSICFACHNVNFAVILLSRKTAQVVHNAQDCMQTTPSLQASPGASWTSEWMREHCWQELRRPARPHMTSQEDLRAMHAAGLRLQQLCFVLHF